MTWPTIFTNLAQGNQPLSLFDTMFTQVAQMVAIPSTPAGTNAITLTPIGTAPALPAYQNFSSFRFVAGATTTAAVTAQYQALGFLNVYLSDGLTQAGNGSIIANQEYVLVFAQFLNAGAGGFFLEAASVPAIPAVAGSAFTNLVNTNNSGTPNTQLNTTYDELVMNNPSGGAIRATSQSFTTNGATSGVVNGLDIGTLAASTWYALWGISNGTTAGGLLSLSFTAPTMPAGYTFKKRIGAFLTNGSTQFFVVMQRGNRAQYIIGTNPANNGAAPINITNGALGTFSTTAPTLSSVSLSNAIPPTAKSVIVNASATQKGNSSSGTLIAPNVNWGGANNGPTGSNGATWPGFVGSGSVFTYDSQVLILLEAAATLGIASAAAGSAVSMFGWEDNLG